MESDKIVIKDYPIRCYSINTLIVGSGAAALNAAVNLHSMGQKDILIATSLWGGGTSNNAGSDKQTYYKLSLSGDVPDSVSDMARDLFNCHCMHGDIALCEAQGSVQAFFNLVSLGVKFPHDKYGSWAGYMTDHDNRGRATTVGPYTSKKMFEVLAAKVQKERIEVLDHHHCISLLTNREGSKIIGALALNTSEIDIKKAFVLFNATNVVLGTGGPGGIYDTSVYPVSQSGSIGMAFKAGAAGQNLTESQFGIASLKFRWNLSGSYQQVIPRYISTDCRGKDVKEFLNDSFPDYRALTKAIFLKGYQWPFDPRKIKNSGSSVIDILVHNEINTKARIVFLDYSKNPSWNNEEIFSIENLDSEVIVYLKNSEAVGNTPFKRLKAMNSQAVDLYAEHGINLEEDLLQIAVCAQHNNGGLKANIWWESNIKNLFPVGEVNGSHGVYRPGGSALNSGQVGSYRAAQYISKKYSMPPVEQNIFITEVSDNIKATLNLTERWIDSAGVSSNLKYLSEIRKRMSSSGAIFRENEKVRNAVEEAGRMFRELPAKISAGSVSEIAEAFLLLDNCITHFIYLKTISFYLENGGRSRGSFITVGKSDQINDKKELIDPELCYYDRDIENQIIETDFKDGSVMFNLVEARAIPLQDLWFEKVWRDFNKDIYLES